MRNKKSTELYTIGFRTIQELKSEQGILASGKNELYGCLFGRDSLITACKLFVAHTRNPNPAYLEIARACLRTLAQLQGKEHNPESGEAPGKILHEYRVDNHEHLTRHLETPWYVYEDGTMRSYDSVDATPLFILTLWRYYETTNDATLVHELLPALVHALTWLTEYGDSNSDGLIDYHIPEGRTFGGLVTQSWMDSTEALFHEDGSAVTYPIAPVEVQAYAYAAYVMSHYYLPLLGHTELTGLDLRAAELKQHFNERFPIGIGRAFELASAIDGSGTPIETVRSSIGHVLWATWRHPDTGELVSVLDTKDRRKLAKRLFQNDLFEPQAGIRTLSTRSIRYASESYHNGSIWPHDTGMILEGLRTCGYVREAAKLRRALATTYRAVPAPVEFVSIIEGVPAIGRTETGQRACMQQAWSAATLVAEL